MKNGKRPSRAQKIMLSASGLDPGNYLVIQDRPHSMTLMNRKTGHTEDFLKKRKEKRQMIISAQFKSKKTGTYGGRKYSYFCDIPGVKPGDYVKVPARDSEEVVLVAEVDVPKNKVEDRVLAIMKSVIAVVEDPDTNVNVTCETCGEFTPIGEGDHICGADPHKMPVSNYIPTADYCWCHGKHFTEA